MDNHPTEIQEIINKRNIRELIHFTRVKNLKSILSNGILTRKELDEKKIEYAFNDEKRLDGWVNASCISVTKINPFLIPKFNERYSLKNSDWFQIKIKPSILTENECIFCDTNAASTTFNPFRNDMEKLNLLKSWIAFDAMFKNKVYQTQRPISRIYQKPNETTCAQAEICIIGKIPTNFFINLKEIKEQIKNFNG